MKPLRILIVDDEPLARERLRVLIGQLDVQMHARSDGPGWPRLQVLGEASDATQAMEQLWHTMPDVVLLDIHLPGASGLRVAEVWRQAHGPDVTLDAFWGGPALIFVSADSAPAVEAFALDATDYLTKPVRLQRLEQAFQKVLRRRAEATPAPAQPAAFAAGWLLAQTRGQQVRIPINSVLYVKADAKYLRVATAAAEHLIEGSLHELETRFPGQLLRVHRNALVASAAILALERVAGEVDAEAWQLRLAGTETRLQVSRRHLVAVRAAMRAGVARA